MDLRPVHDSKAFSPMAVTVLGIVMEVSLEQPEKALYPMESRPSGREIEGNFEQLAKTLSPIVVTVLGILTDVK